MRPGEGGRPGVCRQLLGQLPGCEGLEPELRAALRYFGLDEAGLERAALLLPRHFELNYEGLRRLLAEYVREALEAFSAGQGRYCELSVPAPPVFAQALRLSAGGGLRFGSRALALQVLLRAVLLSRRPLGGQEGPGPRCGLNLMRRRLLCPPFEPPELVLQFGLLCGDCIRACEGLPGRAAVLDLCLNGEAGRDFAWLASRFEGFGAEAARALGIRAPGPDELRAASKFAAAGLRLQSRLLELNARPDRRPLRGTGLSLAQTAQLMCFAEPERALAALELLCRELEDAPAAEPGRTRLYCFYAPLTLPELELGFYERGYDLLGSAAFLYGFRQLGTGLGGLSAAWLKAMGLAGPPEELCRAAAREARRSGCRACLSGGFACPMGGAGGAYSRVLEEEYGLPVRELDYDFWCERRAGQDIC